MKVIYFIFLILHATIMLANNNFESYDCNYSNCDENGGICDGDLCKCKENYTTSTKGNVMHVYKQNTISDLNLKFCNYEMKRSVYAALIELFIGFGMGHFYTGRKLFGCLKLILYILLCCVSFCSLAIGIKIAEDHNLNLNNFNENNNQTHNHPAVKFFLLMSVSICNFLFIWQLFDFCLFMFKVYKDGNNLPLY